MGTTRQSSKITPLPTTTLETLLTIDQVRQCLQVDRHEVYRLIREEGLPVVQLGGNRRRVRPSALARWVEKREQSKGA